MTNKFAIIPAPGYTGNEAKIVSMHATLAAAQRQRTTGWAIIEVPGDIHKGMTELPGSA